MKNGIPFVLLLFFLFGCEDRSARNPRNLQRNSHHQPFVKKRRTSGSKKTVGKKNAPLVAVDNYHLSMGEDQFWEIIDLSVLQSSSEQDQITNIRQQLIALGAGEVVKFELRMQMLLYNSYTSELLCAGELLHRHCRSFGFEQFRCWLILQGRTVFYLSLQDPDSLEVEYTVSRHCFDANALYKLPSNIFRHVYRDDIMNHVEFDKFPYYEADYPALSYSWRPDRPKTMERVCPDLYDACY